MKSYIEASKVPLVEIGRRKVPRIILGIHPYDGISYVSREKDRRNREVFLDVNNIVKVLNWAVQDAGVTVTQADHMIPDLNRLHLVAVWKSMQETGIQIPLIPFLIVPLRLRGEELDARRLNATYDKYDLEVGGERYRRHFLEDPIIRYLTGRGEEMVTSDEVQPYSSEELRGIKVDYKELERYIGFFEGFDILMADPGCEVDLLAMTGYFNLIREYVGYLKERFDTVITSIHHAGVTIPLLEEQGIDFDAYLTTINKLGVFMLPTPDLVIDAVRKASKPVIAIKPQAGGRLLGREAFDYVFNEIGIPASMVGLGTLEETKVTLTAAKQSLGVR